MDFKSLLTKIGELQQVKEAKEETSTGVKHKGKYGTEYQGDADDEDTDGDKKKAKKAVAPAEKRGRGRPKKGADSSTGKLATYSGAKDLQDYIVGNKPSKAVDKLPKKKHTLKDWVEQIEGKYIVEAGLAVQPMPTTPQQKQQQQMASKPAFMIKDPANPTASAITTSDPAVVNAAKNGTLTMQKPGATPTTPGAQPAQGAGSQVAPVHEDELDELSPQALGNYRTAALAQANKSGGIAKSLDRSAMGATEKESDRFRNSNRTDPNLKYQGGGGAYAKQSEKRFAGAAQALAKGAVQNEGSLNELSVNTLSSYGNQAGKSIDKKLDKAAVHSEKATKLYDKGTASAVAKSYDHEDQANKLQRQANKRSDSMDQAAGKLAKKFKKGVEEGAVQNEGGDDRLHEKDIGKHNNATTGFDALVRKLTPKYGKEAATKIAGSQMKKIKEADIPPNDSLASPLSMEESKMSMKKVNGKSVPAFAADGKGKNDLTNKKVKEAIDSVSKTDKSKLPSMAHIKKMCKDGKTVAEICKMHPDCDHKELKQMVADCRKKMIKEGMDQRLQAARMEGNAHGLKGHSHCGRNYDDLEEARCYHEGYKEGLDECYGQMPIQGYVGVAEGKDEGFEKHKASEWLRDPRLEAQVSNLQVGGIELNIKQKGITGKSGPMGNPKDMYTTATNPMYFTEFLNYLIKNARDPIVTGGVQQNGAMDESFLGFGMPKFRVVQPYINSMSPDRVNVGRLEITGNDRAGEKVMAKLQKINPKLAAQGWHSGASGGMDGGRVYYGINFPTMELAQQAAQALGAPGKEVEEGNAFTAALARTPHGGQFSVGGKRFKDRTRYDAPVDEMQSMAFEGWNNQLDKLLTEGDVSEGMSVSISKGQQGAPDSVSVTANDADADALLNLVKHAGLGLFGNEGGQGAYGAPTDGTDSQAHGDIAVVNDHDGMMSLMKKLSGVEDSSSEGSDDYADEEGNEEEQEELGHEHEEEVCGDCGEADCACDVSDDSEEVDEDQTDDQLEYQMAEDTEEDAGVAAAGAQEAGEDAALASAAGEADAADEEEPEEVEESYANGADDTFEADIDFMTKVISGGLNKQKSTGQSTIPVVASQTSRLGNPMQESTNLLHDWKKLSGIK